MAFQAVRYSHGAVVHVHDASRAVGVVGSLLSSNSRAAYMDEVRAEYRKVAEKHAQGEAAKQRLGEMKERVKEMEAQGFIVDDFATWTTNIDGVPHTASEFLMRGDTPRNSIRTLQEGLEIAKQALGAAPQPLVDALD